MISSRVCDSFADPRAQRGVGLDLPAGHSASHRPASTMRPIACGTRRAQGRPHHRNGPFTITRAIADVRAACDAAWPHVLATDPAGCPAGSPRLLTADVDDSTLRRRSRIVGWECRAQHSKSPFPATRAACIGIRPRDRDSGPDPGTTTAITRAAELPSRDPALDLDHDPHAPDAAADGGPRRAGSIASAPEHQAGCGGEAHVLRRQFRLRTLGVRLAFGRRDADHQAIGSQPVGSVASCTHEFPLAPAMGSRGSCSYSCHFGHLVVVVCVRQQAAKRPGAVWRAGPVASGR